MSDLSFARPLCERLANACPARFYFEDGDSGHWAIQDMTQTFEDEDSHPYSPSAYLTSHPKDFWAFFGPLADERNIKPRDLYKSHDRRSQSAFYRASRDERTAWHERDFDNELLESLMVAVVESFEAEGQREGK